MQNLRKHKKILKISWHNEKKSFRIDFWNLYQVFFIPVKKVNSKRSRFFPLSYLEVKVFQKSYILAAKKFCYVYGQNYLSSKVCSLTVVWFQVNIVLL
jgi:hypothetical protein